MRSVAVDLLGSVPPEAVIGGVAACLRADADLRVSLVGPPERASALAAEAGLAGDGRVSVVAAALGVADTPDAEREVRARRDASVRVAARLVRDSVADAFVSFGPVRAVAAAATFAMGTLPGISGRALAEVLHTPSGPVTVVDRGGTLGARADELAQYAALGTVLARSRFGIEAPVVGLLSADEVRQDAARAGAREILAAAGDGQSELAVRGLVSAGQAVAGDGLDVLVTDGTCGAVLFGVLARAGATSSTRAEEVAVVLGVDGIALAGSREAPFPGHPGGGGPVGGPDGLAADGARMAGAAGVAAVVRALTVVGELRRGRWLENQAAMLGDLVAGRRRKAGLLV